MDYYAIGQRIRKIRKAREVTQEALAEQVGISVTHMSHIETGNTKLSLPVLVALASALEVRVDDLLYDGERGSRSTAMESIAQMLDRCPTNQIRVIEDVIKALISSLNQHY